MASLNEREIDVLWNTYIGSHFLHEFDELKVLEKLKKEQTISLDKIYLLYLNSKYWKRIRKYALMRDKYACRECGSRLYTHVDHINYGKMGFEKLENLQTLCWDCHKTKTKSYNLTKSSKVEKKKAIFIAEDQLYTLFRSTKNLIRGESNE
jgi:hypothetical protein